MRILTRTRSWLLPAVLILFLLEVILLPFAVEQTYAGRSESPNHLLTYTTGSLTWDSQTGIGADGVAILDLFDAAYQNVQTGNGDNLVAPGTEKTSIVRLKNDAEGTIRYTALLYRIKEEDALPVAPQLSGTGFSDTDHYPLPQGVSREQVVRAVTGTLAGGTLQDFDVTWSWNYYDSDARDLVDTALGDKAAFAQADEVTAGLYIVVEEEGSDPTDSSGSTSYIVPQVPQTGDDSPLTLYLVLMAVSGGLLVLLLVERRKERP